VYSPGLSPLLFPPAFSVATIALTTATARSVAAENRQVPQGPCGVAFLGDPGLGAYTLLLYKSQENHLARVPFTDQFKLETTVSTATHAHDGADATARLVPDCHIPGTRAASSTPIQHWRCAAGQRPVRDAVQHDSGASRRMDAPVPD
jgi:hypothetical protein